MFDLLLSRLLAALADWAMWTAGGFVFCVICGLLLMARERMGDLTSVELEEAPLAAPEIGFTGTQEGMSEKQRSSLRQVLAGFFADGARVFRHGDCVGADAQAHAIAKATGFRVVIHPPSDDSKRAFCQGDAVLTPRPYLVRNRHIVDASSVFDCDTKGRRGIALRYLVDRPVCSQDSPRLHDQDHRAISRKV
jgi:hypothetical protein